MALTFPLHLFPPGAFHLWPAATLITGGSALAGPGQTVDWSAGGWWMGEISSIRLSKPDQHRTWRAMLMHAASGGEVVMPIIDGPQRPIADPMADQASATFALGERFTDGAGFISGSLAFELAEAAQEGDTVLKVRRIVGEPLRGGEYWTFDHPEAGARAYCIEALDEEANGVREVRFGVPLRTDLAAGAFADFENPRVTMRLISDPKEAWPSIRPPFRADGALRFCESFDYL